MRYLLAIDQGTSSTRAMLYTQNGHLVTSSQFQLTQYYPQPGWVEHDPEEIWETTLRALRKVVANIDPKDILACGITNQRETTLIWDKETGKCLSRAIVWQDRRTQTYCDSMQEWKETLRKKTGLLPDPYFSASKLNWLFKNIPEAKHLAQKAKLAFGTVDSFLLWRLTGGIHATDITNASRTLLYNITEQKWDQELLDLFAVPAAVLPEVRDCDAQFGMIRKDILGIEIPITGVAGDQQAALIGQGCFSKSMIKATYGTGGFLLLNTGGTPVLSKHGLLTTIAYKIKGQIAYGVEGSLYQAGTTVKWLRDEMKLFTSASDTEQLAASLSDNEGVYLVPSFTGLGAPHWISTPGAVMIGLSRTTTPAHFARAALESVAYQTREVLACMQEDSGMNFSILRVDGGMAANAWFLQFLASQCGLMVQRPHDIETTALGAAILAGISIGAVGISDAGEGIYERQFLPQGDSHQVANEYAGWRRALQMLKAGI